MLTLYIGIGVIIIVLLLAMYLIRRLPLHLLIEMLIYDGTIEVQLRVFFKKIQLYEKSFSKRNDLNNQKLNVENVFNLCKKTTKQLKTVRKQVHHLPKVPKTKVIDFTWHTQIGTSNAAETGLAAGSAWTVKMLGIDVVQKYIKMTKQPNLFVEPAFDEKKFETVLLCMVHTKIGETMEVMKYIKSLKQENNHKGESNHEASN